MQNGRLDVLLRDGRERVTRVRQVGLGSFLDEISVYLDREASASVVARAASELSFLSRRALVAMLTEEPEIALLFHRRMAALLAARLADNSRRIGTLVD